MKVNSFLISIILFIAISCSGQNKKMFPTLNLNDKYNQIQKNGSGVIPQNYELTSLNGFILHYSKYDFSLIKTLNGNKMPDVVNVLSKAGKFTVNLNLNGQTLIDSTTLQSLDGDNKKFSGFIKGEKVILAIGTNKNNEMMTYWLGMIDIK
jgi:hypothetical protein